MEEEKKLKEEDLKEVVGGEWDPHDGYKLICNNCNAVVWENTRGPGQTCPYCQSISFRQA